MATAVLTVQGLSKAYIIYPVFEGVSFTVNAGERVALVGPNGVGKSTLLKIIAGLETPTTGGVVKARGMRLVYLPQEAASSFASEADLSFAPSTNLHDSMLEGTGIKALQAELRELEARMAGVEGAEWDRLMHDYEAVTQRFESAGGYDLEHRIEQVLQGLGFTEQQFGQPLDTMSGGQRTRAALARALLSNPDILLLDEPTNHLDIEAIEWLEGFLSQWAGTLLVIAHDRRFLNKVTTRTLDMEFTRPKSFTWYSKSGELRDGGIQEAFSRLQDYPAPYDRYLELKAERYERMLIEYEAQQETIKRTEDFVRRYMEGQKKRQAVGRLKRLQSLHNWGLLERPTEKAQLRLTLRAHVRSGQSVLEAEDLVIGYPSRDGGQPKLLARCPDLEIERGGRVALIGPNGVGKTTLLKTITGQLAPLSGSVELGHNVKFGYYTQAHEGLNAGNTVIDEVRSMRNMTEQEARDLLAKMLFSGDNIRKQIGDLSGGERSRVALTKLTLTNANFLILDEPTNHLDLEAQEALTEVLGAYEGTILFVSHDRAFIDDLATQVWVMEAGGLTTWDGNYSDYVAERTRQEEMRSGGDGRQTPGDGRRPSDGASPPSASTAREASKAAQRQERAAQRERGKLQKRRQDAEQRISDLEARLNAVSDALTAATEKRDLEAIVKLGTEYAQLEIDLDEAYQAWQLVEEEVDVSG
jgi:ATP-binding cassette, subfamily F, member 3